MTSWQLKKEPSARYHANPRESRDERKRRTPRRPKAHALKVVCTLAHIRETNSRALTSACVCRVYLLSICIIIIVYSFFIIIWLLGFGLSLVLLTRRDAQCRVWRDLFRNAFCWKCNRLQWMFQCSILYCARSRNSWCAWGLWLQGPQSKHSDERININALLSPLCTTHDYIV